MQFLKFTLFLFFLVAAIDLSAQQTVDEDRKSVQLFVSGVDEQKQGDDIALQLMSDFEGKITHAGFSIETKTFTIHYNRNFNFIETLDFFHSNQIKAYYVENGMKKELSSDRTYIVTSVFNGIE